MTRKLDQQLEIFVDPKPATHACKLAFCFKDLKRYRKFENRSNCLNDSNKYLQLVRQGIQTKKAYHI